MPYVRVGSWLVGLAAVGSMVVFAQIPTTKPKPPLQPAIPKVENPVIQQFRHPVTQQVESAWEVSWLADDRSGLVIQQAYFTRENKPRMKVLHDARVADIFVPYSSGEPRYWDLSSGYNPKLLEVTMADLNRNLGDKALGPYVVREVRDRGVLWKHLHGDASGRKSTTRRGRELVLWATVRISNYAYMMRYGFQDDGTITFRAGATGHNLPSNARESHMHNICWRVDVDLDAEGKDGNRNLVRVMRHREPTRNLQEAKGRDFLVSEGRHDHFHGGTEGYEDWKPEEFTMLRVSNTRKDTRNKDVAYDLVPHRHGTARHYGHRYGKSRDFTDEETLQHDFYVTRHRQGQLRWRDLLTYIAKGESIENTDIVLWYAAPMHHEPRNEDGRFSTGPGGSTVWRGVTTLMWSGFDLKPRNVFDTSPFYPTPPPSIPDPPAP